MSGVCFASWRGFAGCVTSCRHAAAVLDESWTQFRSLEDASAARSAPLLVLSSWHPAYERVLEVREGPTVGRWHSSLLQTELSREGSKLERQLELLDRGALSAVVADDADMVAALGRTDVVHLPNVLDVAELRDVEREEQGGTNVALPGEPHARKNILVQSAAFECARRGRPWTLHLFGQTVRRPGYATWLDRLGIPYVDHGFLPRRTYLARAAAMDAALCASLAESYGYAAAEVVVLGVPAVVSPAVASVPDAALRVDDPSDTAAVAAALERAAAEPGLAAQQAAAAVARAEQHAVRARTALERLRATVLV